MPAPAWNDSYSADSDLAHVDLINRFVDAANERWWTPGGLSPGQRLSSQIPYKTAGDDFQDLSIINTLQDIVERGCVSYLNPHNTYDGSTYTLDGDYQLFSDTWQSWANYCAVRKSGNSWTRKYPREFASLAATQYTDGSSFSNGHRARNNANDKVYDRTAGAWVLMSYNPATTAPPEPDLVTNYGRVQAGDYIGAWIFTELRDAINDCVWFTEPIGVGASAAASSTRYQQSAGTWPSSVSMADAYNQGHAHFPDPGGPYAADLTGVPACYVSGSYTVGTAQWVAGDTATEESKYAISVSGLPVNPPGTCDVDVLICSNPPATSAAVRVYDNPFGYALRTRTKVETVARGGAPSLVYTASIYGNIATTIGVAPPDIAPVQTTTWRGCLLRAVAIIKCDVSGGYQYHA